MKTIIAAIILLALLIWWSVEETKPDWLSGVGGKELPQSEIIKLNEE